jgi:pimeloyl-ACP methyl ester carboxylesterase
MRSQRGCSWRAALLVAAVLRAEVAAPEAVPGPDPLSADPAAAVPAAQLVELTIRSHGAQLYGVFYGAGGAGAHATIVLLHGFAGFEQNADLAQASRRAGFNVLIFHYRGAWGSTGAYSFAHCVEDTATVLAYLRSPANAQRLAVDRERLLLVGHSVGGHIAGIVAAADSGVAGVAMISAANRQLALTRPGWAEETRTRFQGELGPLRGTSAAALVQELQRHARDWDLVRLAPRWGGRPVLIVSADDRFRDEDDAIAESVRAADPAHLTTLHLSTDHAYSDSRVALARELLQWLGQFSPAH